MNPATGIWGLPTTPPASSSPQTLHWPSQNERLDAFGYRAMATGYNYKADWQTIKGKLRDGIPTAIVINNDSSAPLDRVTISDPVYRPAGVLLNPASAHALAICGNDDDFQVSQTERGAFMVQKSKGSAWGVQGRCWIPYSVLSTAYVQDSLMWLDMPTVPVWPTAYIKFTVNHPERGSIQIARLVTDGNVTTSYFQADFSPLIVRTQRPAEGVVSPDGRPWYDHNPGFSGTLDATEMAATYWPPRPDRPWIVRFTDGEADGKTGSVTAALLVRSGSTYTTISTLPAAMNDTGTQEVRFTLERVVGGGTLSGAIGPDSWVTIGGTTSSPARLPVGSSLSVTAYDTHHVEDRNGSQRRSNFANRTGDPTWLRRSISMITSGINE